MKKYLIFLLVSCSVALASCDRGDIIPLVRLGSRQSVITLTDSDAGTAGFDIISDGGYEARVTEGSEWLRIVSRSTDRLDVSFYANSGFKRSAKIVISLPGRKDSMYVRQPGPYEADIRLGISSLSVPASGGSYEIDVMSNLPGSFLTIESLNGDHIRNVRYRDNVLSFEVLPTTDMNRRTYTVSVYATDGWGERVEAGLLLTQEAAQK